MSSLSAMGRCIISTFTCGAIIKIPNNLLVNSIINSASDFTTHSDNYIILSARWSYCRREIHPIRFWLRRIHCAHAAVGKNEPCGPESLVSLAALFTVQGGSGCHKLFLLRWKRSPRGSVDEWQLQIPLLPTLVERRERGSLCDAACCYGNKSTNHVLQRVLHMDLCLHFLSRKVTFLAIYSDKMPLFNWRTLDKSVPTRLIVLHVYFRGTSIWSEHWDSYIQLLLLKCA